MNRFSSKYTITERMHIGNRWMAHGGLNWYDNTARMHDPLLMRFNTPDPLWKKFGDTSPFAHCAADPVNSTDPDGMETYTIGARGEIISHTESDDDALVMDGTDKQIHFPLGTITRYDALNWKEGMTFDVFRIRGDRNGTAAFEFLAQNTSVEWSQIMTGQKGDKGLNFLSTSHQNDFETSSWYLVDNQLKHGYELREFIHNHPSGSERPSGRTDYYNPSTYKPNGDIGFATIMWPLSLKMKERIKFKIYSPQTNKYTDFFPAFYNVTYD